MHRLVSFTRIQFCPFECTIQSCVCSFIEFRAHSMDENLESDSDLNNTLQMYTGRAVSIPLLVRRPSSCLLCIVFLSQVRYWSEFNQMSIELLENQGTNSNRFTIWKARAVIMPCEDGLLGLRFPLCVLFFFYLSSSVVSSFLSTIVSCGT